MNEIAPRVHNSGHWTQNGCAVDQFEQHIRAVAGWPLGDGARHADVVMENLIGDDVAPRPRSRARTRRRAAPLRQGRGAAGPQDGPCQPGEGLSARSLHCSAWDATMPIPRPARSADPTLQGLPSRCQSAQARLTRISMTPRYQSVRACLPMAGAAIAPAESGAADCSGRASGEPLANALDAHLATTRRILHRRVRLIRAGRIACKLYR